MTNHFENIMGFKPETVSVIINQKYDAGIKVFEFAMDTLIKEKSVYTNVVECERHEFNMQKAMDLANIGMKVIS